MRAKKLTGTYREVLTILAAFDPTYINFALEDHNIEAAKTQVGRDLNRTTIYGSCTQRIQLHKAWTTTTSYTQGDFDGCRTFMTPLSILVPVDHEEFQECNSANVVAFTEAYRFAYWSDTDKACGISLIYKHRHPACFTTPASREDNWMCSVVTNSVASYDERIVTLYFSETLCKRFKDLSKLPIVDVDFFKDLEQTLKSEEVFTLLKTSIKSDGKVNLEECGKVINNSMVFYNIDDAEITICMKLLERKSQLKLSNPHNFRKAQVCSSILALVDKSYNFKLADNAHNANVALRLANQLFEKCESFLAVSSAESFNLDWVRVRSECQLFIEEAQKQFMDFKLPETFFRLDLLYIEYYCKRRNLLSHNQSHSLRKAQFYDQLMSLIDTVQDLDEKFHQEDACQLFAFIINLNARFENVLSKSNNQIQPEDWLNCHRECQALVQAAQEKISNYQFPENFCGLELTYLELQARRDECLKNKNSLNKKKAEVYKHLLECLDKADSMRRSDYKDDAEGAIKLALQLTQTCMPYLTSTSSSINWKQLKRECKTIVAEAEYKLAYYGLFQKILMNLILAITGLCLLKAAFTGSFFVHNPSEECFHEFEETTSVFKNARLASG